MTASLSRTLNAIGLLAVCLVLLVAFVDQIAFGDLPVRSACSSAPASWAPPSGWPST